MVRRANSMSVHSDETMDRESATLLSSCRVTNYCPSRSRVMQRPELKVGIGTKKPHGVNRAAWKDRVLAGYLFLALAFRSAIIAWLWAMRVASMSV